MITHCHCKMRQEINDNEINNILSLVRLLEYFFLSFLFALFAFDVLFPICHNRLVSSTVSVIWLCFCDIIVVMHTANNFNLQHLMMCLPTMIGNNTIKSFISSLRRWRRFFFMALIRKHEQMMSIWHSKNEMKWKLYFH